MKLIVQIPCYNEEETLPAVLADLPSHVPGFDTVEWLVIDDGSRDGTVEVARAHGVHHIVRLECNRGLAGAFLAGLDACVKLGADVIVNTDGDNQYFGGDVPALTAPIVAGEAEIVVGDRQVGSIPHFSKTKIALQHLGSWVVRLASATDVADAPSGFRAMTREIAMRTTLNNRFSYTLETIIQHGAAGRALTSVPIKTNAKTRESRLFKGIRSYLKKSVTILVRIYTMHRPLRAFFMLSLPFFGLALGLGLRWLFFYFTTTGATGHIQSLIVAAISAVVGVQIVLFGLLGDLLATNRRLSEEVLYRTREMERVLLHGGTAKPPTEVHSVNERSSTHGVSDPSSRD
jgi:glycosyltransferase involved in cell wall biosynthesis